jgi:leucyl-tRNA synthetase
MPNWAGSCWYFLRFAQDSRNETLDEFKKTLKENKWMPVDWYLGGAEHAVLHLLYARFWVKALKDLGLVSFPEPFLRLRNVGMVLAEDHRKMSKSWGNTINPDDVVTQFGADTLRMYEMFMAPFNMEIAWSTTALQGGHRFLKRVWALYNSQLTTNSKQQTSNPELVNKLNKTIQKVGADIAQTKFNTAIAALMEFLNAYELAANSKQQTANSLSQEEAKKFIQIIAPFAPFITEKIWRDIFKEKTSIHLSVWPLQTKVAIENTTVKLPIQIQGQFRGVLEVPAEMMDEKTIETMVLKHEVLAKFLTGKEYKLIYVKGRICNFVIQ